MLLLLCAELENSGRLLLPRGERAHIFLLHGQGPRHLRTPPQSHQGSCCTAGHSGPGGFLSSLVNQSFSSILRPAERIVRLTVTSLRHHLSQEKTTADPTAPTWEAACPQPAPAAALACPRCSVLALSSSCCLLSAVKTAHLSTLGLLKQQVQVYDIMCQNSSGNGEDGGWHGSVESTVTTYV